MKRNQKTQLLCLYDSLASLVLMLNKIENKKPPFPKGMDIKKFIFQKVFFDFLAERKIVNKNEKTFRGYPIEIINNSMERDIWGISA